MYIGPIGLMGPIGPIKNKLTAIRRLQYYIPNMLRLRKSIYLNLKGRLSSLSRAFREQGGQHPDSIGRVSRLVGT